MAAPDERPRAQVVDLMEALKASLAQGGKGGNRGGRVQRTAARAVARRPAAAAGGRKR